MRVVVCSETCSRKLSWRGYCFKGTADVAHLELFHPDGSAVRLSAPCRNPALTEWVNGCITLMQVLPNFMADDPLHAIEDPDAYAAALAAYEAEAKL